MNTPDTPRAINTEWEKRCSRCGTSYGIFQHQCPECGAREFGVVGATITRRPAQEEDHAGGIQETGPGAG